MGYCIFGYIFNAYRSKNWGDIRNNVPNWVFWRMLPKLTYAGCIVTYAAIKLKCCTKQTEGEGDEMLVTDDYE